MYTVMREVHSMGPRYRQIPFISAVSFTNVQFNAQSPEWHDWQVIDRQRIYARPISATVQAIMHGACNIYSGKGLPWASGAKSFDCDATAAVARRLRPFFEFMISTSQTRKTLDEDLLRCTQQQIEALDRLADNARSLIEGPAGTGKTCLAVEATRRDTISSSGDRRALFCFNRNLGDSLQRRCRDIGCNGVAINLHRWLLSCAGVNAPDDAPAGFWSVDLPRLAIEKLLAGRLQPFDFLVVDEAQDLFTPDYLDVFDVALAGGLAAGRWMFFGDFAHQDIYSKQKMQRQEFKTKWAKQGFAAYRLDVNCRNTLESSQHVTLLGRPQPGYSATLRGDTRHDPELLFYSTSEEQDRHCAAILDRMIGAGFRDDEIMILSSRVTEPCAARLVKLPRWRGRLKLYQSGERGIRYSTIHAFKGLESPVIILTDLDELDQQSRTDLLYIGMTRALHRLAILANEASKDDIRKALN